MFYPTVHTQQSTVPLCAEHNVTVARAMGAFVTFWDNDAGSKIHLLANWAGPPIGAARQEDSLLESQMQLGQPYEGSRSTSTSSRSLRGPMTTVRNIDIDRAGYLRHRFIAGFPTEQVPKMPLSGVSTRSGDLARFTLRRSTAQ